MSNLEPNLFICIFDICLFVYSIMDYFNKLHYLKRYSSFQHRTGLIYFLSVVLIVASLAVLAWFYSSHVADPKAYLVQNFQPNIRYVLAKSDVVSGTASPNGYVKVILKEPKITLRAKATSEGKWLVKIPQKMPEKAYQMQIISFDNQGKNPKVKQVKVRVESNNAFQQSWVYKQGKRLIASVK